MKSDEGIFKMLSNSIIIRNQYENVIPFSYLRILKRRVFTRLFFYLHENKSNEQSNEQVMNNLN